MTDYLREAEEALTKYRTASSDQEPQRDLNAQRAAGDEQSNALLSDARLRERANEPVRIALLQSMQQTHGNRAVQRFVQGQDGSTEGEDPQKKLLEEDSTPVQRTAALETLPGVEDVAQAPGPAPHDQGTGASPSPAGQPSEGARSMALLAGAIPLIRQQATASQNQIAEVGEDEQKFDEEQKRVDERAEAATANVPARPSAAPRNNSGLVGVFENSVAAPIREARDNMLGEDADAQFALQRITQSHEVSGALVDTYRSLKDDMLAARLSALTNGSAAEMQALRDHVQAPRGLGEIGKELDISTGWLAESIRRIMPGLHNPQRSSGPVDAPANPALQAVFQAAVVHVLAGVRGNLLGEQPNSQQALADLTRAVNVTQTLADTYGAAGDEFMSEQLAALYHALQTYQFALQAHDHLIPLRALGKKFDPEEEPLRTRLAKIREDLH